MEFGDIRSVRQHISIIIIIKAVQIVNIDAGRRSITEKLHLIQHPLLFKNLQGFFHRCISLPDGNLLIPQLLHSLFYLFQEGSFRRPVGVAKGAVEPITDGKLHLHIHRFTASNVSDRFQHHHTGSAMISHVPRRRGKG